MSKELKTPAEVTEAQEKDREEQATTEQVEEKEDYLPNVFGLEDLNGCGIRFNVIEMSAIRESISYSVCSTHPDEPYYKEFCFLEKLFNMFFERSSFLKYEKSTGNDKLPSVSEDVFNDDELPFV